VLFWGDALCTVTVAPALIGVGVCSRPDAEPAVVETPGLSRSRLPFRIFHAAGQPFFLRATWVLFPVRDLSVSLSPFPFRGGNVYCGMIMSAKIVVGPSSVAR